MAITDLQLSKDILAIGPIKAHYKLVATRLQNKLNLNIVLTDEELADFNFANDYLKRGAVYANEQDQKRQAQGQTLKNTSHV